MNPAVARFHDALEGRGCKPRKSGNEFKALCPTCQLDGRKHSPGLSFGPGDEFLAHTVNEHVPIEQIATAMDGNAALARALPGIM